MTVPGFHSSSSFRRLFFNITLDLAVLNTSTDKKQNNRVVCSASILNVVLHVYDPLFYPAL